LNRRELIVFPTLVVFDVSQDSYELFGKVNLFGWAADFRTSTNFFGITFHFNRKINSKSELGYYHFGGTVILFGYQRKSSYATYAIL
jgi:hypothetical protein